MKFKDFVQELDKNKDYFHEWVQDSKNKNIFYYWRNEDRGYKTNLDEKIIENISHSEEYSYHPFENKEIKEELDRLLGKRIDELNKLDNVDDIFEKWLIDEEDNSRFYYWKGPNKGYLFIIENNDNKLPRIKGVELLDGNYLEPSIMKEFKNYKIKRALNQKLEDLQEENLKAKKNIFGHWTEDKDGTFYYWKNENEGYMALVEGNNFPEITTFEIINNEYFEPRTLEPVKNHKIKKVLDKKIK